MPIQSFVTRAPALKRKTLAEEAGTSPEGGNRARPPAGRMTAANFPPLSSTEAVSAPLDPVNPPALPWQSWRADVTNAADMAEFMKLPRSDQIVDLENSFYTAFSSFEQYVDLSEKVYADNKILGEKLRQVSAIQSITQGAFYEGQAKLAESQREKEELSGSVCKLEQEKEELLGSVCKLEQEKEGLAATVERLMQELVAEKEATVERLMQEFVAEKESASRLSHELDDKNKELEDKKKELEEKLRQVSALKSRTQGAFDEGQAKVAESQREKEELLEQQKEGLAEAAGWLLMLQKHSDF